MGIDIHVKIAYLNKQKNIYEEAKLFVEKGEERTPVEVYSGRNTTFFDLLTSDEFPHRAISLETLSPELKNAVAEDKNEFGFYGFYETTLADMQVFSMTYSPRRLSEEEEDFDYYGIDSLRKFIEQIKAFMDFYEPFWDYSLLNSDIKILYWFDR